MNLHETKQEINLVSCQFVCVKLSQSCIEQRVCLLADSLWLVAQQSWRHVADKWRRWQQIIHLNISELQLQFTIAGGRCLT